MTRPMTMTRQEAIARIREAKAIGRRRGHYVLADRVNYNPLRLTLGYESRIFTTSDRDFAERLATSFNRISPRPVELFEALEWSAIRVPQLDRLCGGI
jgi:hypothetical protein